MTRKTYRVHLDDTNSDEATDALLIRANNVSAAPTPDGRYAINADGVEIWFESNYIITDVREEEPSEPE